MRTATGQVSDVAISWPTTSKLYVLLGFLYVFLCVLHVLGLFLRVLVLFFVGFGFCLVCCWV